ncbi:MAG: right-handed parallel beta-helix repeat-containing protein, partial [Bacteroidota bacterium]
VNALPTATASSNSPICAGTTLNLSASGGTSYAWMGVNSFSSTQQNPSINSATTLATGTYQVNVTDANGCTAVATTSVVVNALPTATASSNSPICAGTTLNLSASGGVSYAWTGVNSFSSTQQNPSIISATTLATGTYQVVVTNAAGCTAVATTSATVNALPTATASSNSPICTGTTLNLSASGGTSYAWTGVNSFSSTQQNPSITSATTLATGTYQVIVTNENGCTAVAMTSVIVNTLPTATASSNSPICSGTTLSLSASGGTSYAWTGVNSFSSTLQNPSITSATSLATGTYQVVVTNRNGCTAVATTSAIVNPTPVTPTTQANTQIIFGGSITLTATGCSTENDVLKWYQSADNVLVIMPISPTVTSNYYAKCETTLNGITCISSQSADVTVTVLSPTPPIATGSTICISTPLTLTATGCSGSTGTFELKWYQNSDNTLVTMPVSPSVTTDYYAKCEQTFNSITAVSDKSNVVTLTVLNPAIPVATGATIYNGNSTTLIASGCTGEGSVVKWYETATNTLITMPISPIATTLYYAKCEQTANHVTCSSSKSNDVVVKVVNRIFVDITKASAPIQNGNSWASAYGNLQTGLAAATASVEVWVAKGTYKTTTTLDRTISFNIPDKIIVYGGFAGTENALSERNFRTNVSTLSGDIGTQGLITDNSYHVVIFSGSSNSTVLDGFTITGGNANFNPNKSVSLPFSAPSSTSSIESGGGIILANAAMPMIVNCTVMSNSSVFGGGLFAEGASKPSILFCKFMGNQATFGAGIYLQDGSHATINNTLISGNRGVGGLYNNNSNPTITNTTFSGNGGYNGGIFNSNSRPVVKNSIIWGNSTQFNDTQSIITYSIIQGGYEGTGNLNYDPQFVNQAPEGLSPNLNGDYHLKASSLGIDRGNNGSISPTDLDLDGNLRRYNEGRVDMGAYELQGDGTSKLVISAQTGDWEINSTWVGLKVPQLGDVVIIDSNHIVTINNTATAKSIQYQATGQVKFKSTSSKLNIGF